jgi:hypothetical protein
MKLIPELQARITPEVEALLEVADSAAEVLRKNGFECFVAGGFIRDAVLGIAPSDIDIFIKGPDRRCDIRGILTDVLKVEGLTPKGRGGYGDGPLKWVFSCPLKAGDEVWNADLILVQPAAYTDPSSYVRSYFAADISRFWLDEKGEIQGTASAQQAVLTKRVDFFKLTSDTYFKYFSKLFLHKLLPLGFTATIEGQLLSPNDGEYAPPLQEMPREREPVGGRRWVPPVGDILGAAGWGPYRGAGRRRAGGIHDDVAPAAEFIAEALRGVQPVAAFIDDVEQAPFMGVEEARRAEILNEVVDDRVRRGLREGEWRVDFFNDF